MEPMEVQFGKPSGQKLRRETLVGVLLAPHMPGFEGKWSRANPDRLRAQASLIAETFEWAEAVIAESDRREQEGR